MSYETKRDGVKVMIVETGEVFNSIVSCANYLGVNSTWLGKVVRGNDGLCTCKGYHIVRADDTRQNDILYKKEYRGRTGIKVRVVETGDIYNSISECAEAIDGSAGSIHDALNNNRYRCSHKGLHFEKVD